MTKEVPAGFPPKPPAPSVRETIGRAVERVRSLRPREYDTDRELVEDILSKVKLPPSIEADWRKRYGLTLGSNSGWTDEA